MQRKRNSLSLLVGMQIGAAPGENSMEFPQKTKNGTPIWPSDPRNISQELETPIRIGICIPMFIAAQFTITKIWKQPKYPSADEWIKMLWYAETGLAQW